MIKNKFTNYKPDFELDKLLIEEFFNNYIELVKEDSEIKTIHKIKLKQLMEKYDLL